MAIIKTTLTHRANRLVNINGVELSFDEKLIANIEDSSLSRLKPLSVFELIQINEKGEEIPQTEDEVNLNPTPGVNEEENLNTQPVSESTDLNAMNLKQLKDICKEAELPTEEWENLKKAELVEYIKLMISSNDPI